MNELKEKIDLLEEEGFKYLFDRDIYCNPEMRKCFSLEFITDSTAADIKNKISRKVPQNRALDFYFNDPPSSRLREDIKNEIKSLFNKGKKK